MTAKLLQAAGVFMGDRLPVTAEDPEFATLLREVSPDRARLRALIRSRDEAYSRWGFKAPYRNHWDILENMEGMRFVIVFRDVLAVANRNHISVRADLLASMKANMSLMQNIVRFIERTKHPVLAFSYEKALLSPEAICEEILEFVGTSISDEAINRLVAVIRPNEPEYLRQMEAVRPR